MRLKAMDNYQEWKRISPVKEFMILVNEYFSILMADKRNLIISLLFPVLATVIEIWIAGKDMFYTFESTKSGCFVLVSAAIWGGLFNSIQSIVKDRNNIKRSYVTGIRFYCYTASRIIIQLCLCVIQSLVLASSFLLVSHVWGRELPRRGVVFENVIFEYWITILLVMYVADMMGFMISCFVKKTESANVLAPYILIVQLIFSGILFKLNGAARFVSYAMISRWGMEGLGTTCDTNSYPLKIELSKKMEPVFDAFPDLDLSNSDSMFKHTQEHLLKVWIILLIFSLAFIVLGDLALHSVSKDTR